MILQASMEGILLSLLFFHVRKIYGYLKGTDSSTPPPIPPPHSCRYKAHV